MRYFSNKIALNKNSRGVYDLDTSKGCYSGLAINQGGCYGECYAAKYSKTRGFIFRKTIIRDFENILHLELIRNALSKIDMPFVRFGVSGDPSENWGHLIRVLKLIKGCDKKNVVITKHWNNLTRSQLNELCKLDVCINTSISALDSKIHIKNRLLQYEILKDYCRSVLRVVSCDFNTQQISGMYLNDIQDVLFSKVNVIDNVLRVSKNNKHVKSNLINIKRVNFLSGKTYVSMKNKHTHIGYCKNCEDMCGLKYY